jgi:hypothetical protein
MGKSKINQLTQSEEKEIAQIIPIRTETILSQYPLHRLAKKANLDIRVTKTNARGRIVSTWEVSPSRKYGEPGPLAYKLDTLLVNRAIDEARPHIPEVIRLGSLRDICGALGLAADTNLVKKALLQNASAFITAKLSYQGSDGAEKTFEFGATRYEVVFVGQKLPNGQRADAVFIILHRTFRDFLEHAKIRPLDYEYLKALPPAAQRLYELISFQIFAALKNGNTRARYLYSDFCKYAPLTRYEEWDKVKKQLYKVHKPHKESSYVSKIEFEEIIDEKGILDWVMWYTPGQKARSEFKEFTMKRIERSSAKPILVPASEKREGNSPLVDRPIIEDQIIQRLTGYGLDRGVAARLTENDRAECEQWADAWPYQNKNGMKNPPAILRRFIEEKRRPFPKEYESAMEQEEKDRLRVVHKSHKERHLSAYHHYLRDQLKGLECVNEEAYTSFNEDFERFASSDLQDLEPENIELILYMEFERFAQARPDLGVLTFWDWDLKLNSVPFKLPEDC